MPRSVDSRDRTAELTRYLAPEEIDRLRTAMRSVEVPAGARIITAGEPNDALFLLLDGELLVSLPGPDGPMVVGARYPGSWVGEVTLVDPGPATATVAAARDSRLQVLSAADLNELIEREPGLAGRLLRAIGEDLARRVRNAGAVLESAPKSEPTRGFFSSLFGRLFGTAEGS